MPASSVRDYTLARAVRARLVGVFLVALGLVVLLVTVVLAALRPPAGAVTSVALSVVVLGGATAALLGRRRSVVRLDDTGYRIRYVRGAGRSQARWTEVEDLTTTVSRGAPCVVLRIRDGQLSTIPVALVDGDREELVHELQRRLDTAHGYRRL